MPTLIAVFSAIAVLVVIDVFADISEGTTAGHVAIEAGIAIVAVFGIGLLIWRVIAVARNARLEAQTLVADLAASRRDAVEWRTEAQDLLRGLGAKIDSQFEKWQLTPAEKEVALLLLKGFSHKDVARLRSVGEPTARQQARAIYKKAGIAGRHDLAGFFLEDLVLPHNADDADDADEEIHAGEPRPDRIGSYTARAGNGAHPGRPIQAKPSLR